MLENNNQSPAIPEDAAAAVDKIVEAAKRATADKAEIARLAGLSLFEYERERTKAAEKLGIERLSVLDEAVKAARRIGAETKGQGRPIEVPAIEPWPHPVNGAAMLDEVVTLVNRYMVLPDGGPEITALWAAHTHCFDCFGITPRLAITSPVKGCGKTTLLDLLEYLVAWALLNANMSSASIFRVIEIHRRTILLDEADTFLVDNDEMRGLLNAGYRRDGKVIRLVGDDHEPREFSVFGPVAIAMIGRLPDTLEDRSVAVSLRRKKANERTTIFRHDRCGDLTTAARKMARWADDNRQALAAADPDMGSLFNRVADNWRPLFAIADAAGGDWPKRCRDAAGTAQAKHDEQSIRIQLLVDLKGLLRAADVYGLTSETIIAELVRNPEGPWAEFGKGGKPLSPAALSRLLKPFQVFPSKLGIPGDPERRGYPRHSLIDAFECYLPPSQPVEVAETAAAVGFPPLIKVAETPPSSTGCEVAETAAAVGFPPRRQVETPERGSTAYEDGQCAQCGLADGAARKTDAGDCFEVWLHSECKPFYFARRPLSRPADNWDGLGDD